MLTLHELYKLSAFVQTASTCVKWLLSGLRSIWGLGLVVLLHGAMETLTANVLMNTTNLLLLGNAQLQQQLHDSGPTKIAVFKALKTTPAGAPAISLPSGNKLPLMHFSKNKTGTSSHGMSCSHARRSADQNVIYDMLFSFLPFECQNKITTATSKRGSYTSYYCIYIYIYIYHRCIPNSQ